ncbi:DUF1176 domain-containing protein [Erwinia sp. E602]|uniref:DUF1176 domain-containing protein n=1 Tax=unclassified Erwinia TaxID=2622719 RepID=UPI000C7831A8|nr:MULTISPECIES: DUF1176 domain-containing protein [unclassified Erwinia]QUG74828.1 DUF1176 domain-containing protein [Erwinia sp. E602]
MFSTSGIAQLVALRGVWLGLAPLFCIASLQAEPLQKIFADWQITCNNLNTCEVRSFPASNGLVMQLTRDAGEDDRPRLSIDYGNRDSGERPGGTLQDNLLLDGKRLKPDLKNWQVTAHHWSTADAIAIEEFLQQVRDADNLQLLYRPQAAISLHGLKAALLLMDEVQGRVKSGSAWVASGAGDVSDLPPPPDVPQISSAPRPPRALSGRESRQLLDYASWHLDNDLCSLDPLRRESQVAPLSDNKALLLVSCEMGAYNLIYLAFEVNRQPPFIARLLTLTLPFVPSGASGRQLELVNAEFDAARGELQTFSKTRGLGDCGVATRWQYDGHQFRLAEYAQQSLCDGWNGSERWPTLWVTQRAEAAAAGTVEMLAQGQ